MSAGVCLKNGWSNSQVFLNYLIKHFAKYVKLTEGKTSERVLVLFDRSRSHISLSLADWAKKNNVLFVLPPHSSHVTQPLDVMFLDLSSQCTTQNAKII